MWCVCVCALACAHTFAWVHIMNVCMHACIWTCLISRSSSSQATKTQQKQQIYIYQFSLHIGSIYKKNHTSINTGNYNTISGQHRQQIKQYLSSSLGPLSWLVNGKLFEEMWHGLLTRSFLQTAHCLSKNNKYPLMIS